MVVLFNSQWSDRAGRRKTLCYSWSCFKAREKRCKPENRVEKSHSKLQSVYPRVSGRRVIRGFIQQDFYGRSMRQPLSTARRSVSFQPCHLLRRTVILSGERDVHDGGAETSHPRLHRQLRGVRGLAQFLWRSLDSEGEQVYEEFFDCANTVLTGVHVFFTFPVVT